MRFAAGVVFLAVGVFFVGGPLFAIISTMSGGDVFVRGGIGRLLFDLVVGCALVVAGLRRLARPALA